MGYKLAVVGATGNVGREILQILAEREFPVDNVTALASSASVGRELPFGPEDTVISQDLSKENFAEIDIVLASAGADLAKRFALKAATAGAIVIDNSSAFRMADDIPLVVPEVNPDTLSLARNHNIVASPNCVVIPLTIALKPLQDIATIQRVVASTYQSTSGAGHGPMEELFIQTQTIFMNKPIEKEHFSKQIAFNVIPHIDSFNEETGYTGEEEKVIFETKKILSPNIAVTTTCVRVPVFIGHAISATIEFVEPITIDEARAALKSQPGIAVVDYRTDEGYVTPVECAGEDKVYISRIRQDPTVDNGLAMWIVCDNLRKGAALNTVQIAESLVEQSIV